MFVSVRAIGWACLFSSERDWGGSCWGVAFVKNIYLRSNLCRERTKENQTLSKRRKNNMNIERGSEKKMADSFK